MPKTYERARCNAALALKDRGETGIAAALPSACTYTLDQLLDPDWLPPQALSIGRPRPFVPDDLSARKAQDQ